MPIANITVNPSSPQGPQLRQLRDQINSARNLARQLKEQMEQQVNDAPPDYAQLESQFGLPSGMGKTVFNLVASLTGTPGLLEKPGIAEFCGRLN